MKKHGTVPQLSAKEIFDLGAAIFQQLPRHLDPDKVRIDLGSKGALGRDLGKFFRDRYAAPSPLIDMALYTRFFQEIYGKTVDLSTLLVPVKPEYESWPVVVVPGLVTNNDRFEASGKLFGGAWRYVDDLNTVHDIVERPKGPYVVWVKAVVEADQDLANVSAETIVERKLNTLTLGERLDLGLQHFFAKKEHLDTANVSLCAGSRYADGSVPYVRWFPAYRKRYVDTYGVRSAAPHLRARAAVVPEA